MIPLRVLEEAIDRSGAAARIEALLPIGVRGRQLLVRTLLLGMLLVLADHRPAHLTRVHHALTALPEDDQARPGVVTDWKTGPHQLTCRQTGRTSGLVTTALARDAPDGLPSAILAAICDDLTGASIPPEYKDASTALAADWTGLGTFSRPPPARGGDRAGPEASRGHRRNNLPGPEAELFYGYYLQAATMMPDEGGPPVPGTGPPHHPHLLPPRPRPRARPRARPRPDPAARTRHPARRHPRRLRLRPPHPAALGPAAARGRRRPHPGPAPRRPRTPRHPPRRHHLQRQPVLPRHSPPPARTQPPGPQRHQRAGHRARYSDRRARPLQARQDHR